MDNKFTEAYAKFMLANGLLGLYIWLFLLDGSMFFLWLLLIVGVTGAMIVLATQFFFRIQDAQIARAIETFESGGVGEKNKMDSSV